MLEYMFGQGTSSLHSLGNLTTEEIKAELIKHYKISTHWTDAKEKIREISLCVSQLSWNHNGVLIFLLLFFSSSPYLISEAQNI